MCVLVIIDCQNDFVPGPLGSKAAAEIEDALYACRMEYGGDLVVFTKIPMLDLYPKSCEGRHISLFYYIKDTEGWQIHGELKEISENCIVIDKESFEFKKLADALEENGCDGIEIAGVATNICVIVNAVII